MALQAQVKAALGQSIDEIAHRLSWVTQRMAVLKDMIGQSLELLRVLIKVCLTQMIGLEILDVGSCGSSSRRVAFFFCVNTATRYEPNP